MDHSAIRADLHAHTTASDGALSPSELIEEAAKRGLTHIAISDHDTLAGIPEALDAAQSLPIEVVPGIELTCKADDREIHMLGLGVDTEDSGLREFSESNRQGRKKRYAKMIELLCSDCGLEEIDAEEVTPTKQGSLGRPQLARELVDLGYVDRMQKAFDLWLGRGKPAYVPNNAPDVRDAIQAILGAGGAPVLAHCGLYRDGEKLAADLFDEEMVGVEVFHPDHSNVRRSRLIELAQSRGAVITGGADFHEFAAPKSKHFGKLYVEREHFEGLCRVSRMTLSA